MVLNKFRQALAPLIDKAGLYVARTGLPPFFWSSLGLLLAALSGIAYSGLFFADGFYGGLLLLISGLADVLDGSVAKAMKAISSRGAFIDSTFDRLSEVMVFLGILMGGHDPLLVVLALTFSLLVSYVRARGESLGVALSGTGIGERAERILVLAIASMLGYIIYGVALVLILALITFVQRLVRVLRALR